MSFDVVDIIKDMDFRGIELQVGLQCAPVIAGIKASNLFTVSADKLKEFYQILETTSLSYHLLYEGEKRAIFLVYRRRELKKYLQKTPVKKALRVFGYESSKPELIFPTLMEKYEKYMKTREDFPHELGLLLEYPVEDVFGFIVHQGKNFLYSGYWKVYAEAEEKIKLFQLFEEVQTEIVNLIHSRMKLAEIVTYYENCHLVHRTRG